MLIQHSERESALHERQRGYKAMKVDASCLTADYNNKACIIGEITELMEKLEENAGCREAIESKFQ